MGKKSRALRTESAQKDESLVPFIEEEERRLETRLEEARTRTAASVAEAEEAAREKTEACRRRVPELQEERRRAGLSEIEQEAKELEKELSERTRLLRERVDGRIEDGAEVVVDLVWPGRR